jgi:hypothetical protein
MAHHYSDMPEFEHLLLNFETTLNELLYDLQLKKVIRSCIKIIHLQGFGALF